LKKSNAITIKSTNKYSIITICNYDSYQQIKIENDRQNDQQLTNNQPATNQQLTTTKNIKNKNNEKKEFVYVGEPTKKFTPQTIDEEKNYIEVKEKKETETEKRGGVGKKFVRPTIDEVENYIKEKGYNIDAERFVYYYESNGWKVGKNQMKDWKAAIVTWSKNEKQQTNNYKTFERQGYRHPFTTILSDELSKKQIERFEANKKAAILRAQNRQDDT
jgi:hypothetical protein